MSIYGNLPDVNRGRVLVCSLAWVEEPSWGAVTETDGDRLADGVVRWVRSKYNHWVQDLI